MQKLRKIVRVSNFDLFVSPSVFFIVLFYFIPVILIILMVFFRIDYTLEWLFVGFDNFRRLFSGENPLVLRIIRNTVLYVVVCLPVLLGMALLISLLTMIIKRPAMLFFRAIFFFPRILPGVVWALLWVFAFGGTRYGAFNSLLIIFGLDPIQWLTKYAMLVVILANSFLGVAFASLIFTSSIANIPEEFIRAAKIDGASFWQLSKYIIIPLLKWPVLTMSIWHLMSFMNSYIYILLITKGGPYYRTTVWSLYGYQMAFVGNRYGMASSVVLPLLLINIAVMIIAWKIFGIKRLLQPSVMET